MVFVNWFTDDPLNFELPKGATLFSVAVNPMVKDRIEYLMTYWIENPIELKKSGNKSEAENET